MKQNPKMAGSNLIDCIPQHGPCPNKCDQCFYVGQGLPNLKPVENARSNSLCETGSSRMNAGVVHNNWFYAGDEPVVPTLEEVKGKIVRVNSGNDSNNQKELVLETTRQYPRRFYNTSVPDLDFGEEPVVLTINPRQDDCWTAVDDPGDLMFVRFRANTWNLSMAYDAIKHYCYERDVPLVMTFMRYYDKEGIQASGYEFRKHIDHSYWDITQEGFDSVMDALLPVRLLYTCGTPENPYCRDCGVCETLYWRYMCIDGRVDELLED